MSRLLVFFITLLASLFLLHPTLAQAKHTTKALKGSPKVQASVAKNRLSVSTSFTNLSNVKSFTYNLTYNTSNGPQGAGGTVKISSKNKKLSRKILLGTCSKNVCTYHKNVKNVKLSVDFKLKSGGTVSYEKEIK